MEMFETVLVLLSLLLSFAMAFVVYHVVTYALNRVNVFRASQDKKPFSSRVLFLLSLACALSFVI